MRLDFSSFAITGPYTTSDTTTDTGTDSKVKQKWGFGVIDPANGVEVIPLQGQCKIYCVNEFIKNFWV